MTPQEARDYIDIVYAAHEPTITSGQDDFLTENARYFQGLCTNSVIPYLSGGVLTETVPDKIAASDHPTDFDTPWNSDDFPPTLPAALIIQVYEENPAWGYFCILVVILEGARWERHINYGFAEWLNKPWFEVVE